jgi:hypothetical protein
MTGVCRGLATRLAKQAAFIEDAQWLVDTGECWSQAIHRLGYTGRANALERRLERAGHQDLITALRARELTALERDWHAPRRTRTAA